MTAPAVELEMQDIEPGPDLSLECAETAIPQSAASRVLPSPKYCLFDRIVEHNLKFLHVVCKLGILPFDVDAQNRRLSPSKTTIRWCWFYFISFICLLKVAYVDVSLVASLLNPDWMQVLHFPFHLAFAIFASTIEIFLFLRPKLMRLGAVLLTEALSKRDRVKSFSLQQFMAAIMPMTITTLGFAVSIGFPVLTTVVCQFGTLLRVVSERWNLESPTVYIVLRVVAYALDAYPYLCLTLGAVFTVISHLLILEVLNSWCEELRATTNSFNIAEAYGELMETQIIIKFYNQIYAENVFFQKVFAFSVGISALVTVFWYGFDNFFMGVVNLYMGIATAMLYPLTYEKAALISDSMEMAKKSLLVATADFEDEQVRAFWRRKVKAVRVVSVMCGPRPFERESLPLFYDFFFSNFISVLLTT